MYSMQNSDMSDGCADPLFPGYQKRRQEKTCCEIDNFPWSVEAGMKKWKSFTIDCSPSWDKAHAILTLEFAIISRCAAKEAKPAQQPRERERGKFFDQQLSCFVCLFLQALGKQQPVRHSQQCLLWPPYPCSIVRLAFMLSKTWTCASAVGDDISARSATCFTVS